MSYFQSFQHRPVQCQHSQQRDTWALRRQTPQLQGGGLDWRTRETVELVRSTYEVLRRRRQGCTICKPEPPIKQVGAIQWTISMMDSYDHYHWYPEQWHWPDQGLPVRSPLDSRMSLRCLLLQEEWVHSHRWMNLWQSQSESCCMLSHQQSVYHHPWSMWHW